MKGWISELYIIGEPIFYETDIAVRKLRMDSAQMNLSHNAMCVLTCFVNILQSSSNGLALL